MQQSEEGIFDLLLQKNGNPIVVILISFSFPILIMVGIVGPYYVSYFIYFPIGNEDREVSVSMWKGLHYRVSYTILHSNIFGNAQTTSC